MQKNNKLPSWYKSRIGNWKLRKVKILPQFETYWQQYAYFYLKANKCCEICHKPLRMWYSANISPAKYKHMETANLDHNHKTGDPRGIIVISPLLKASSTVRSNPSLKDVCI